MDFIDVLSDVDDTSLGPDVRPTVAGQEQAATDAVEDVVSEVETYGVENTVRHIEHGAPVEIILDVIESERYSRRRDGDNGETRADRILLRSFAEKTVRSAPVPVITVGKGAWQPGEGSGNSLLVRRLISSSLVSTKEE